MHAVVNSIPFREVGPNGRLREPSLGHGHRQSAILIHVFVAIGAISAGPLLLVPLILWLVNRDESAFVDDHGREAINFILSMLLFTLILVISIVGLVVAWVPGILMIILPIRAALIASKREYIRYPMTIRFF